MADLPNDADLVTDMSTHVQPIGMWLLASKTNYVARIINHL